MSDLTTPGTGHQSERIAVVLPMYNEAGNVQPLMERLDAVRRAATFELIAVAVNDGSRDNTSQVLANARTTYPFLAVVEHPSNRGMAAALRTGITTSLDAIGEPADVLAFMDADLTHNPDDLPRLVAPILRGEADFVLGSRYVRGGAMRGVPWLRQAISIAGNHFARLLLDVPAADLTSGFRAARAEVFRTISMQEPGFGIQLEGTVKARRAGFRIAEVPTTLGVRKYGSSKMVYNWAFWVGYGRLLLRLARRRT
jgi:dolichol-phosphate mannosyltransferase